MRQSANRWALVAVLASLVTGCTLFPSPEPPRVMDFSVPEPEFRAQETQALSVRVELPYASDPINSNRILAKPNSFEFQLYDGVRWRDTIPVVIRDLLIRTLRASNGFAHVISDSNPADADWTLVSELASFHTENNGSQVKAVIELHGQMIDNRSRKTLCAESFQSREPTPGASIEQVVAAFGKAGEQLANAVARWASACRRSKP